MREDVRGERGFMGGGFWVGRVLITYEVFLDDKVEERRFLGIYFTDFY